MISSVLVANRGEIARRIFRTCRELGIATVAVYSDPDAGAPHVREADAAVRLPGAAAADTYLRADLLVKAALAAGADTVHPGYGFLSENAEFARAVTAAGLRWIGPPAEAIEAMASKTRAKELMARCGVPLLAPLDPERITAERLPVLVKAAAGGGGRGMRVVRELAALPAEVASAAAEAAAAFGDGEVFVEPYVERGRHVEVQILADAIGTTWALGTRDCSLQRRHQKVIEEAPAPGLAEELRETLHGAAVAAARAIGYVGAGTVEFLVTADGRPYFLEMNTRLQVEHPVTEAVFRLDLVALQLRIAEGEPLPAAPPPPAGHAVEARLYAEDPARGWAPQAGPLYALSVPGGSAGGGGGGGGGGGSGVGAGPQGPPGQGSGPYIYGGSPQHAVAERSFPTNIRKRPDPYPCGPGSPPSPAAAPRVDAGYADGDVIGTHYDPMLAKVVVWAPTRAEAVRRLAHALERARIHGPVTNRDLLVRSLRHPDFLAARVDTGFYGRHLAELTAPDADDRPVRLAALAAALADAAGRGRAGGLPARLGGWRNLPSQPRRRSYRHEPGGDEYEVRYRVTRRGPMPEDLQGVAVVGIAPEGVTLEVDGVTRRFSISAYGDRVYVDTATGSYALTALPRFPDPEDRVEPGSLLAPMPGAVVRIAEGLAEGDRVTAGQPLLWLEAMKMEHKITAPADGVLAALHATPGRQVEVGALLAVVVPERAET
ncbi:biotin carboxylase N-terminal domain-containing protein [Streptomyces sp. SAJ15]|uniref:ATP-binding protein n=1 Tax=Streptomyces sp. SAJ15 TaxID=2011095 RepID=UPI001184879D|nr:biotin carboxylase N-terminal domain-containing protein [Streptomyces sp. SAJ15]TVL89033.1 acety-l/propionyl-CoA carboxylase subunit alpha [Streptomyces sp. SAJ15]